MNTDFCPKDPIGITMHSVGKWRGYTEPISRGGLGPKARETEAGSPYILGLCGSCCSEPSQALSRGAWSPSLGILPPSSTHLSFRISQCLSVSHLL